MTLNQFDREIGPIKYSRVSGHVLAVLYSNLILIYFQIYFCQGGLLKLYYLCSKSKNRLIKVIGAAVF